MDEQLFQQLLTSTAAPTPAASSTPQEASAPPQPAPEPTAATPAPAPQGVAPPAIPTAGDVERANMASGAAPAANFFDAAGGGVLKSVFETKDFLLGETPPAERSDFRSRIEARNEEATKGSIVNSVASTITQFTTGMLGAGKLLKAAEVVPQVAAAAAAVGEKALSVGRAAAVGAIAFDPHQERLSNLAEQVPIIGDPLFGWLAAHPTDTVAMGRMKAALESIGLDVTLLGAFMAAGKLYKAVRGGTPAEVQAATEELQAAQARVPPEDAQGAPQTPAGTGADVSASPVAPEASGAPTASPGRPTANDNPAGTPPQEPNAGVAADTTLPDHNPTVRPVVVPTKEDAEAIITSTRADLDAIDAAGSVQGAVDEGHKFASGAGIPWDKLHLPGEVDDFLATVADRLKEQLGNAKGGDILTDASVARRVNGLASYFNIDPGTIVGRVMQAGEDATKMVSNMEAAFLLSNRMHMDAFDLASRIGLGDISGFATREAAVAEFQRQVAMASSMFASGQSMRAAFGRGLRRLRPEFAIDQATVANINKLGGEQLMQLFRNSMKDPNKLKMITEPSFIRKASEELGFMVQNNLLWGWGTHVVNFVSNAYMAVARPAERIIGGTVQQALGVEGGAEVRQEALKQYGYMLSSWTDGLPSVWNALKASDGILDPRRTGAAGEASRNLGLNSPEWLPMNSTYNILHNAYAGVIRPTMALPTRVLTAADEMAKQTVYRSKKAAQANMEGLENGLSGPDLQKYVKDQVNAAFDETGKAIDKATLEETRVATFSQDLLPGTLGVSIRATVAQHPLLRLVLPFTQTPTNIFRYTAKMTPGANLMQQEFRDQLAGKMGGEAQANAIGQFAIGSVALPAVAVAGLNLTGGGPQDPKVRGELMATGWRPYSLVVESKDGTRNYLPIGRIDPIALPFGIVADIHDYLNTGGDPSKAQGAISALAFSLIRQAANKTYLQGVTRAADAFTNPGQGDALMKFGQGLETMAVPFSSALRNYNPDPFMRDARNLTDALVAITPGISQTLPAKYDGLGQPIRNRNTFISSSAPDPVTREMQRLEALGYTIPPATPTQSHADLRDVTTVDGKNAYEAYQQLAGQPTPSAKSLKDQVGTIMDSAAYKKAPDGYSNVEGTKTWMLEGPVAMYRKAALQLLMKDKNVRTAILAEQQRVINAYKTATDPKAAAKGPWDTLRDIGSKFGVQLQGNVPDAATSIPTQ